MIGVSLRRFCGVAGVSLLAAIAFEAGGCATAPPPPPPPSMTEVRPMQPTPKAVWVPGHWRWTGGQKGYVWVSGYWRIR